MTKTRIDIDSDQLSRAQEILGTATTDETVHQALALTVALADRRRYLESLGFAAVADAPPWSPLP